jgi:PAS domain S-box-containing protein
MGKMYCWQFRACISKFRVFEFLYLYVMVCLKRGGNMKLREIMTINPLVLKPLQTVRTAAGIFTQTKADGAPVVDENNKVIGLLTKNKIFRVMTQGIEMETKIEAIMTKNFIAGNPDDELEDLPYLEIGVLPIIDENGLIIGIISQTDIARAFFDSYHNISNELATIINSTHNLIISIDEQGKIKVFNKSAEDLLGKQANEVIGKNIMEIFPSSGLMDIILEGHGQPLQEILLNNRSFLSNRTPIKKDGIVTGAVAVLQDMSELNKISVELDYVKELNKEMDAVMESFFDGVYITDGNGITLRLNKAFESLTGAKASECIGRNVYELTKEGVVSESVTSMVLKTKQIETLMQETGNNHITLSTGVPVFDDKGNIIRVVSNVRDITELSILKQKLDQAQGLSCHYESQLRTIRSQYSGMDKMVVKSKKMKDLLDMVIRLAQVDSTVLITGETGTGKELIAETIHNNSSRKDGPFIRINCGAIPDSLLESELFGYESGAFTGAKKQGKAGYFELANDGTLFLDEIGDLPYHLQVKFLRVLQNKEVFRVGGEKPIKVNNRIITATNKNLLKMIKDNKFREDLYYRVNVVSINIPPLRDRKEDITPLALRFTKLFNRQYKLNKKLSPQMLDCLMKYNWPGNVRELENTIERLVVVSLHDIPTLDDLPSYLIEALQDNKPKISVSGIIPLRDAVESVEKQILQKAYSQNQTTRQIAKQLKVDAATIVRKAAKYGIYQSK